ncbi:MAG: universal stress protein [Rubricoccaceae bacterium]|nr:universal stress protein [Rubricoccaceae bacterium]
MLRLRRLLFTTDYTAGAERAFSHAAYLAALHGAELHVLHAVAAPRPGPLDRLDEVRITAEEVAEQLRLPTEAPAPGEPVALVEVEREGADSADVVLDYVREADVDLVVMGTHGRRGLDRLLSGSVAEAVVRRAPCPVLVVPPGSDPAGPIRRILAPVDFSEAAHEAARHAHALATRYGARLDLLHVVDETLLRPAYVPLLGSFQVGEAEAVARAQMQLRELAQDLGDGDISVCALVGHPALTILDVADAEETDLLVIGSHGRSGIERLVLGSVAERVLRAARCPVFVLKSYGRLLLGALPPAAAETPTAAV